MCADAGMSLALGFIGNDPVHRDNARALLAELISAYRRDNKTAKIRFIFPSDSFSETMSDLADYCMTSGHQIGLVGSAGSLTANPYYNDASGNIYSLREDTSMPKGMVGALSVWDDARLILIADPNADDDVYTALVTAAGMGIKVRSLLHGLDEVLMETPEEEPPDMHVVEDDEYNGEESELEEDLELDEEALDDEVEVESPSNLDDLAARADEDNDEAAQVELTERAKGCGLDPDHYATWAEVAVLVAEAEEENDDEDEESEEPEEESEDEEPGGAEDEDGFFDTALEEGDEEAEEDDVEDLAEGSDDDEEEEEPEEEDADEDVDGESDEVEDEESEIEEEREPVPAKSATKKWTEASLIKLGERDKEEFYAVCEEYGVYPGRGQKVSIMARKVMDEISGDAAPAAKKRAPAKKAPAKKVAAKRTAPVAKKAPAKKVAVAKKAPAKRTSAATRAPARTAASTNGHVDKAAARKLLKLGQEAIALAESLL